MFGLLFNYILLSVTKLCLSLQLFLLNTCLLIHVLLDTFCLKEKPLPYKWINEYIMPRWIVLRIPPQNVTNPQAFINLWQSYYLKTKIDSGFTLVLKIVFFKKCFNDSFYAGNMLSLHLPYLLLNLLFQTYFFHKYCVLLQVFLSLL